MKETAPGLFKGTYSPLNAAKELNIVFVSGSESTAITQAYAKRLNLPSLILPHKAMSSLCLVDMLQLAIDIKKLSGKTTSFVVQIEELDVLEIQALVEKIAEQENKTVRWKTLDIVKYRKNRFSRGYNYRF